MPNFTENLNLQLQLQNEFYDVDILNQNFKKIDAIDFEVGATKATFEELKQLVDEKKLSTGAYYILTDYQCTYVQPNTNTIMTQDTDENIILTATSENTFSKIAFSDKYKQDIIYYTLDDMFSGSIKENFKGCILRRNDTVFGINVPYDWRNIKLNRRFINIDDGYKFKEENKQYRVINDLEGKEFAKGELCIFYDKILMKTIKDVKWDEASKIDECFEVVVGDYKSPIWINEENKISSDLTIISKANKDIEMISPNSCDIYISDDIAFGYVRDIVISGMCNRIVIKGATEGVTLEQNNEIEIGSSCKNIIIMNGSNGVKIKNSNSSIIVASNSYGVNIEYDNMDIYIGESTNKCYIGNSNEKIYIGKKNKDINIGNSNRLIYTGYNNSEMHYGHNGGKRAENDNTTNYWQDISFIEGINIKGKDGVVRNAKSALEKSIYISKDYTIQTNNWSFVPELGVYRRGLSIPSFITSDSIVDFNIHLKDLDKAVDLLPVTETIGTSVYLYATKIPEYDIKADIKIINEVI